MITSEFSSVTCFLCFFQPRLFYFYHTCICVFVPGFYHTAGSLRLLAWIPCCSVCGSVPLMGLLLHGKQTAAQLCEWLVLRRASFGRGANIHTSSPDCPQATYSNPLQKHSKAFCSFPFTLYHFIICIFCAPDIFGKLSFT